MKNKKSGKEKEKEKKKNDGKKICYVTVTSINGA